jgi:DNA-binding NarL/FixJ family response regulator
MSNFPKQLFLVDEDPVFRLGLRFLLLPFSDLQIIAEADEGRLALQMLQDYFGATEGREAEETAIAPSSPVDLMVLDLRLGCAHPNLIQGLQLCQEIKSLYPTLPVLLLNTNADPVMLAAAQQAGADGFLPKTVEAEQLVDAMRQVISGQSCWMKSHPSQMTNLLNARVQPAASLPQPPKAWAIARRSWRLSGVQQIEASLAEVSSQLQDLDLPLLDRAILSGRRRELSAALWLVQRLLATPHLPEPEFSAQLDRRETRSAFQPEAIGLLNQVGAIVSSPIVQPSQSGEIQSILFDAMAENLQTNLYNQTGVSLELDILREEKKRELLYLILRQFEEILRDLRFSQVQPEQLVEKRSTILRDLWQGVTHDFFGRYATIQLEGEAIEIVDQLLQDGDIVETEALDWIPFVPDLLAYLLFQTPLTIDDRSYAAGSPECLDRAELILGNLLIQVGNATLQPLLNRFADVEPIKQSFYDYRLMSSREIERFRNHLSWKYRWRKYIDEPKDIFESQYHLLTFTGKGIKSTAIYAPRRQELNSLTGIPWAVTFALETRDAIAPRLRSLASVIGSGFVYVLTEVVGRGIGLVGRGVLKGLGSVWPENKGDRSDRPKL